MVKILHTSDIHLDSPFPLSDPEKGSRRKEELRETLHNTVTFAIENGIDIFIVSGDLFDIEFVTAKTMEFFISEMNRAENIRFVITPGSHDYYHDKSVYEHPDIPSNCFIFKKNEIEKLTFEDIETDIYGFAYVSEECAINPLSSRYQLNRNHLNLLVCYGETDNPNSKIANFTKDDISMSGYDYIALGGMHRATKVDRAGSTFYAYPGCMEARYFDETGSKGAIVIEYTKQINAYKEYVFEGSFSYKKFAKRRYESIEVDVTGMLEREDVINAIKRKLGETHSDENTICRITLTGNTTVDFDLYTLKITGADVGLYYIEFKDKTLPTLGSENFDADITIRGVFYRELRPLLDNPDEKVRERARDALKIGLQALNMRKD